MEPKVSEIQIASHEFERMFELLRRAQFVVAKQRDELDTHVMSDDELLWMTDKLLNERRLRTKFISGLFLGEPVWDVVLDLFKAELQRKPISISSACLAANVPQTTALRYITSMTDCGMLIRRKCPHDARVVYIELSRKLYQSLRSYLSFLRFHSNPYQQFQ
jgi:hypothetical protein